MGVSVGRGVSVGLAITVAVAVAVGGSGVKVRVEVAVGGSSVVVAVAESSPAVGSTGAGFAVAAEQALNKTMTKARTDFFIMGLLIV